MDGRDQSRNEAALGKETILALQNLKVLVIGCRGSGCETAKNMVLVGPSQVCVWDPAPAQLEDMGCNFYLTEAHCAKGTPRATACQPFLQVRVWSGCFGVALLLQNE